MSDLEAAGGVEQDDTQVRSSEGSSRRQADDARELSDDIAPDDLHPEVAIDCGRLDFSGGPGAQGPAEASAGGGAGEADCDGPTQRPPATDASACSGPAGHAEGAEAGSRGTEVTDAVLRRFLTGLLGDPGETLAAVRLQGGEGGLVAAAPVPMGQGHVLATPAPLAYAPPRARGRQRHPATLSGVLAVDGDEWELVVALKSRPPWSQPLEQNFGWLDRGDEPSVGPLQPMAPRDGLAAWQLSRRTGR